MKDHDAWMRDTGITCAYDEEPIEYTDGVTVLRVVKPYIDQTTHALMFYDIQTFDNNDYLYEPVLFHSKNWDEIEEKFDAYRDTSRTPPVSIVDSLVDCRFCRSGVLAGETMGVATFGEVLRSQRNPDLSAYGNHFEDMDRNPTYICVVCLLDMNKEVHEFWEDGVSHNDECAEGTYVRCWRDGCDGNCPNKIVED